MNQATPEFVKIVRNPKNWPLLQDLFDRAATIVNDFDSYGEVLQSDDDDAYSENSAIEQLRGAIYKIDPGMVGDGTGDYLPWLSKEQQDRLKKVAIEIVETANGESIPKLHAEGIVNDMTPRERLEQLPDDIDWQKKRLGFDPKTGQSSSENADVPEVFTETDAQNQLQALNSEGSLDMLAEALSIILDKPILVVENAAEGKSTAEIGKDENIPASSVYWKGACVGDVAEDGTISYQ